ncbi:hypothetical protein ACLK2D_12685 [Escherichia coli]
MASAHGLARFQRYGSGLLLVDGVKARHTIWLVVAGYALFLAVIFFFGFKYNHDPEKITHRSVTH